MGDWRGPGAGLSPCPDPLQSSGRLTLGGRGRYTTLGVSRPGHREVKPPAQSRRACKEQRRDLAPVEPAPPSGEMLAEPTSSLTAGVLVPVLALQSPGSGLGFPHHSGWVGPSDGQVSSSPSGSWPRFLLYVF